MSYIKIDAERGVFKTGPRFAHLVTAEMMWMRTYRNIFVWRVHTFRNYCIQKRVYVTRAILDCRPAPIESAKHSPLLQLDSWATTDWAIYCSRGSCSPRHLAHGTPDFTDTCCRRRNGPLSLSRFNSTNSWSCPPVSLYLPRLQRLLGHQKEFCCHLAV